MGELLLLLIICSIGGYYFYETFTYNTPLFETSGGPAIFPRIILVILFICLVIRAVQILTSKERKPFAFLELFKGSRGIFLYSFFFYILLMQPLGYIVATMLYLTFISHYFIYQGNGSVGTVRSVSLHVVVYLLISFALYGFFSTVLNVNIPSGILRFIGL